MKSTQFKMLKIAGVLFAAGMFSNQAMAATETATAGVTATLITPITITKVTDLNFGAAAIPASGSGAKTVIIDPASTLARSGSANLLASGATVAASAASFTIAGQNSLTYSGTVTYTGSTGKTGVTLTNVSTKCGTASAVTPIATGGSIGTCTLDGSGADTIYLGGTISIADTVTAGDITAGTQISVTVAYN